MVIWVPLCASLRAVALAPNPDPMTMASECSGGVGEGTNNSGTSAR